MSSGEAAGQGATGPRRPTMRDVAAAAGVSLKTVSRVVNAEPGVSAPLVERVQAAVRTLGFTPHVAAGDLRRSDRRTRTVGLLLEDVANPWSSAVQRAVEDVAVPRGVLVFSASLDQDPVRERELTRELAARRADGIILVPAAEDQGYLEADVRAGTVVVAVDRECVNLAADSVVATNTAGAAEGVRHLLEGGHRRVAYLGDRRQVLTARQRHRGYLDALAAARVPVDPSIVVQDLSDPGVADGAVTTLLTGPQPPTALFTAQNLVTIGALRALRRLGLERSVALVGFDDFPLADLMTPGVTVVAQDPATIGRRAAEVLFDRLAHRAGPPQLHVVPTTLVRRGSGELPPRSPSPSPSSS